MAELDQAILDEEVQAQAAQQLRRDQLRQNQQARIRRQNLARRVVPAVTDLPRTRGKWGSWTSDDGLSRPISDNSTDPRMVIARVLARRSGWTEIRPGHWADAGRIVTELKTAGQLVDRRRKST